MSKLIDLTGQRFGRLTVVCRVENGPAGSRWLCKCDCGGETTAYGSDLRSGHSSSCGCLRKERILNSITKHGCRHTTLYHRWLDMKNRCYNPKASRYERYGGRGITVCNGWRNSFEAFRDWALANGYSDDLSIDRTDPNGNYCPENCRWVSMKVQAKNKSNTITVQHNGNLVTLPELAELTGIGYATLLWRYKKGYTGEQLIQEVKK